MTHTEKAYLFLHSILTLVGITLLAATCYAVGIVLTVLVLWKHRDNMGAGHWKTTARIMSLLLGVLAMMAVEVWVLP